MDKAEFIRQIEVAGDTLDIFDISKFQTLV